MEERHELTKEIFGYCLIIAVVIWGLISLFCPLITPDELSAEDQKSTKQLLRSITKRGNMNVKITFL